MPYMYVLETYFGSTFIYYVYRTCYISLGPVFQCGSNCGICFMIKQTIYGNFSKYTCIYIFLELFFNSISPMLVIISSKVTVTTICDMGIIRHQFSIQFHLCQLLCNPKSPLLLYMIWASQGINFQFDFTCGYYIIQSHHHCYI